jgi:two-component system, OmpR family, sensor histidine kinase KdpD
MKSSALETVITPKGSSPLSSAAVGHAIALAFVAVSGVLAVVLQRHLGLREPSLVFLSAVLLTAAVAGLGPSLLATASSVLAYDYFFTEPYHTFSINDPQDVLSVIVFLAVAVLTSHLVARVRDQTFEAQAREARIASLYAFTRDLAAAADPVELPSIVARHIGGNFHAAAVVQMSAQGKLAPRAEFPPGTVLPASEREAASLAWADGRSATMALQNAAGERWAHVSLGTIRGEVAVLSLQFAAALPVEAESSQLLDAFTQQAGVALERCALDGKDTSSVRPDEVAAGMPLTAGVHALEESVAKLHQDVLGLRTVAREIAKSMQSRESATSAR